MKARVLEPQIPLYTQPDLTAPAIIVLSAGQEIEISGIVSRDGQDCKVASLPEGRQGYLSAKEALFPFRNV